MTRAILLVIVLLIPNISPKELPLPSIFTTFGAYLRSYYALPTHEQAYIKSLDLQSPLEKCSNRRWDCVAVVNGLAQQICKDGLQMYRGRYCAKPCPDGMQDRGIDCIKKTNQECGQDMLDYGKKCIKLEIIQLGEMTNWTPEDN